jgi:tetratricopeptide (TPR) repeat protein
MYDRILSRYPDVLQRAENGYLVEAIQYDRGMALALLGRAEEALPLLEEALAYPLSDNRRGWLCYNLGYCFNIMKQPGKAKVAFERARTLSTEPVCALGARYNLGALYAKEGALGKALQELEWCEEHFVEGDVPKDWVYGWLAKVLRAAGRDAEADRYQKLANPPT